MSWGTTSESLREAFAKFGEITDAVVVTDRDTGRSRGFGFVTFTEESAAHEAMDAMNGTQLDGRTINVNEAQEKGGRGGGGRGGRGGVRDRW